MTAQEMYPALVSSEWLASELNSQNKDIVVLDATFTEKGSGLEDYNRGHIPSARFFDLSKICRPSQFIPHDLPEVTVFQEILRSLGVNNSSHIILYESAKLWPFAGARVWWMIRAFGHVKVSVLNGGLANWTSKGFSVTADQPCAKTGDVTLKINSDLIVTFEQLAGIRSRGSYQIVDARPPENFSGQEQEPSVLLQMILPAVGVADSSNLHFKTGAIPGAKNVPYPLLYDKDLVSMRPTKDLKELFQWAGVDLSKPMLTTCYVGYTACKVAMAAHLCGNSQVPVYFGSWLEYCQKSEDADVQLGSLPEKPAPFSINLPSSL